MRFPHTDPYWMEVRSFLEQHAQPQDALLAPNEFLEFFPGTYYYSVSQVLKADHFTWIAFHKGMVEDVNAAFALDVVQRFHPVLANAVFVVYAAHPIPEVNPPEADVLAFAEQAETSDGFWQPQARITCAAVITTYNRPQYLARSLPALLALNIPVIVVDDGSDPAAAEANQAIATQHNTLLLRVPQHRDAPSALTMGLSYWLADPNIAWISVIQDNVAVTPQLLTQLAQVQDANDRPLLTGCDDDDHPTLEARIINDHSVLLKRSMSGAHLHAHRHYWADILPIPTPPRRFEAQSGGSDEDWWITVWSPHSIVKRGGYVVCLPGLVTRFEIDGTDETREPLVVASQTTSSSREQPCDLGDRNPAALSLEGVRVLVDGYNLQLTKGTGIKTYGLSLMQALNQLNAHVDLLLSRNGYRANEVLDEIYFFDNQDNQQSLFTIAKGLLKTATGPLYRAKRRQTFSNFVVKRGQFSDDFLKYAASFNLPQCYDVANALYKKLNISTHISVPEKIDLWHATYPLPMSIRGARKITTIHDLIPLRLPYATLDDKENFYFKIRDALKESAVIITVSEHSKQDLLTYFDADPDRIVVTYQPIALDPANAPKEETSFFLKRYGLNYQNYLLFVGAIEPKKNVGRLIDAYSTLDTDMPLVIVGKKGWLWEDELARMAYVADSKDSQKKVKLLEYVSTDSLRYLYRGAYCFVFPSLYEGFGLPPVEAMNFGCPVITSNVSCLPEVCGDAALYVDPYDVRDIKQKLEDILGDRQRRNQLAVAGRQVAKQFSMENYLQRLHAAYSKALG